MNKLFHPLLVMIAKATSTELQQYIDYLKAENQILRSKLPRRVDVTPAEREKLVKVGKPLGGKLKELMSIVSPRTFTRWANGETKSVGKKVEENKGGRPRKPEEVRELVIKMAKENTWGLGRILGELKKLGLASISKGTVRNILLKNGFELGPKRGPGTWDEFIKIHAKTLWACDFFSKKVVTIGGIVEYFVLFFIQPGTRQVHIAGITATPDGEAPPRQE
jgi:putative transposase